MTDTASTDASVTAFETDQAQSEARQRLAETARTASKAALFAVLQAAGITHVRAAFDGQGDEGQIEAIEAMAGDAAIDLPAGPVTLTWPRPDGGGLETRAYPTAAAIEELAYDCLGEAAGGWQDNDGAYGEFDFDVAAGTVMLALNTRVSDVDHSEHVF